jgi:hypothetical protein
MARTRLSPIQVFNPYKFSVYRSTAWTSGSSFTKVQFDTKIFDIGGNYDNTTNFRFTAPVAGFYLFTAAAFATIAASNTGAVSLYRNGSEIARLQSVYPSATQNYEISGSQLLQLAAGDYIEVWFTGSGGVGVTGQIATYFTGFLVSAT